MNSAQLGVDMLSIFEVCLTQTVSSRLLNITFIKIYMFLSLEQAAAAGIGLHVNAHKTEHMCFNQRGNISTLNSSSLKLIDKFTYLGSSVSSTEIDIIMRLAKAWTAIDRLLVIWKSDLTNKMKCSSFQAAVVSILLYGCTTWMLTKHMEKKFDSNYTRMLWAILYKSSAPHKAAAVRSLTTHYEKYPS